MNEYIDVTQDVFSCNVYPGDSAPSFRLVSDLERGDACTLTDFSMCAHNGTHIDAPSHFIRGGKNISEIDLTACIGECTVRTFAASPTEKELSAISCPRLLIRGSFELTPETARAMSSRFRLIGVETQSVGGESTHKILLGAGVVVLEGLVLSRVSDGAYELFALPLKLGKAEGAPVRALLKPVKP